MRIITLFILFLFITAPASALYYEAQDDQGTYFVEDARQYPIIFLPGVAGSELWLGNQNLWPGWLGQRITGGNFDKLALDKKGRSDHSILAKQSIRSGLELDLGGYGTQQLAPDMFVGIYGPFFEYMENEGYSTEELPDNGLRLLDFAYDWRKDNYLTIKYLDIAIDDLLEETKSDKVILFAHSMGGVIARLYLADEKRAKKVAGVVFMGSPHQGSPKPFYAFVHGYNFGNAKLSDTTMWEIMGNWEAGYQLLAHYPYVQDENGDFWPVEKIYGDDWIGQQEYEHYIDDPENWDLRYGLPNRKYAENVVDFQQELGSELPAYDWIQYYMIEGSNQETTQYFEATLTDYPAVDKPVLSLKEVKTMQGDGTVPTRGAKVDGLSAPPDLVSTDHGSIPGYAGTQPLLTFYREKLNDEVRRFDYSDRVWMYAETQLGKVQSWPSTGSVWDWVSSLFGSFVRPDVEKISVREELRGKVRQIVEFSRMNIVVADGTDERDEFYLVINEAKLVDGGPGKARPSTARVYIDSWQTFDAILDRQLKIEHAYQDGKVKLRGVGVVNQFMLLVGKWFSIYANRNEDRALTFDETLRMIAQEPESTE